MNIRYTGIQPQYFPRLHYFARALQTDIFVFRDDVQFVRKHKYPDGKTGKSYQAHSPIKQPSGLYFLHVPLKHNGVETIAETKISYENDWIENQLKSIENCYKKALNFTLIFTQIKKLLERNYSSLAELNIATFIWGISYLLRDESIKNPITTIDHLNELVKKSKRVRLKKIKRASQSQALKKNVFSDPNEKILALCKEAGANEDFCGATGVNAYMDESLFEKNGIKIHIQNWECTPYRQQFSKQEFIADLSIIDLLMNVSKEKSIQMLTT